MSQSATAPIEGKGGPSERPCPGRVDGEDGVAMVGKPAGLCRPDRAVHGGAVDEENNRQRRIERPAAGGREDGTAVNGEIERHRFRPWKRRRGRV